METQIPRIRAAIAQDGTFVAPMRELAALFGNASFEEQFRTLVQMAQKEGWTFTFLPDRRVEVSPLNAVSK